ncbi:MAG TPA: stage II sporulation protein R [Bacillus sp. (in: firmicutes)]|nr:stage II sporulation protein R [Bacillus sp. (in: firmicutes)]
MKKYIIIYFILLLIGANGHVLYNQSFAKTNEPIVIPDEAIRLRILANSDSDEDQALKREVRDRVNAEINKWVAELTSVEAARELIKSRLPIIQGIAEEVVEEKQAGQEVKVDFGTVRFPTKLYGQYLYPAGEYEAILITLGKGEGANWWCVLFPPLCFLDFSNGEAVKEEPKKEEKQKEETLKEEKQQVEVKFFLVEIFSKLFH